MKIEDLIPTPAGLTREVITTVAGLLIAAWLFNHIPRLKAYIKASMG